MHGREGGREGEGVGALLLVGSQQCVKKLKKLSTTLFFCSRGTDCIHTLQPGVVFGASLDSILFVVVVVFLFLFSEMLPPPLLPPPSPYAVAARQIPTYLPDLQSC